ncbi:DNA-binding transcriptional regulator YciT [Klebsiella pneumoniae]
MNARQQSILQVVIDKGRMSVADLAKMTGVSEVTIRQDLNLLEKQSYLRRTHGYAVPLDSEDVETRMMTHFAIKRELASRAAALVNTGVTVFIENGSSNAPGAYAGRARRYHHHYRQQLYRPSAERDPGEVILLGGIYQKRSESMVGPLTRQFIQQVHFSKAFIGIDGWQAETGFTGRDMMRADVVNAVLEKHCEAIILSDSSKFSAVHPYPLGPAGRFNRVITDDRLPDACREQLLRSGLTVDIVPYI